MAIRKQSKSRRVSRKSRRGGNKSRSIMNKRGGAVLLPKAYFGGDADNYYPAGDAKLVDGSSAYGQFHSVSQGVAGPNGMYGPNVGPYPGASCTQTGGRRTKQRKTQKRSKRSTRSRSRSHSRK
jgi:hypothetical protein